MIKINNTVVNGWEAAIRGARNPLASWNRMDSEWIDGNYEIGPNDLGLMQRLSDAGSDHGKFMRYIDVTCDITAPLYWFKEFDTYKVGTVANSTSTMHCIHKKEFKMDDFSHDHMLPWSEEVLYTTISTLNYWRDVYLNGGTVRNESDDIVVFEKNDKRAWYQLIQLLPDSYNQTRTVHLNYAVIKSMYFARRNHKLDEWREGFCGWVENLPYNQLIIGKEEDGD